MQQIQIKDSLVILVHGTYAAKPDDEGDDWWQQGSPCWNALQQRLAAGARLPEKGEVFHWSGNELLHTSYFDHDEVLDLMVLNIAWATGKNNQLQDTALADRSPSSLNAWFRSFKAQVAGEGPQTQPGREDIQPIAPQRRKAS